MDFIAAYVIDDDAWYIIPIAAIQGYAVHLNPRFRHNKYRKYREAWDLLIHDRIIRRWFRKPRNAGG